jgi:hypothetical protein
MITLADYQRIRARLLADGYGEEIEWQAKAQAPEDADHFAQEAIYVICNSGMRQQTARKIYERVMMAVIIGRPASSAFGHKAKCRAIELIWANREWWFRRYIAAPTEAVALGILSEFPHIGPISKYHLAKNFGLQVCKPDRHLVRLASAENCTPEDLCRRLAQESGNRVPVVDLILWRACNLGIL